MIHAGTISIGSGLHLRRWPGAYWISSIRRLR